MESPIFGRVSVAAPATPDGGFLTDHLRQAALSLHRELPDDEADEEDVPSDRGPGMWTKPIEPLDLLGSMNDLDGSDPVAHERDMLLVANHALEQGISSVTAFVRWMNEALMRAEFNSPEARDPRREKFFGRRPAIEVLARYVRQSKLTGHTTGR